MQEFAARIVLTSFLLAVVAAAPIPSCARDNPHDHSTKVAHNQAKAQQKAMKKSAKAQRKELEKAHKRAPAQ